MTRLAVVLLVAVAVRAQNACIVEGRVTNAIDGQPVGGAVVVLQGLERSGTPPDVDSYIARTAAGGEYRVEGVVAGRYEVRPQRDGYTAVPPGVAPAKAYVRFTVAAGETVNVVALLIPLGAISGRVLDPAGEPVSGVRVEALRYAYSDGRNELKPVAWNNSDDRGEFRIEALPAARYYLVGSQQFRALGSATRYLKVRGAKPATSFVPTYSPGVADPAGAVPLDLAAGGEVPNVQIRMLGASAHSLRVKISGEPKPGSRPMALVGPASGNGMFMSGDSPYGTIREFPNLPPASYVVEGRDDVQGLFTRQIVDVSNGDVEVTLTLAPEITLTGTARAEGGVPLSFQQSRIRLDGDHPMFSRSGEIKADGTFTIRQLQPTAYRIRVTSPPNSYLKSLRLGDRALATPEIDSSRALGALTITFAPDGGKLDGLALDASGAPSEGASVVLVPDGKLIAWPDLLRSGVAGKGGKFELRDIAPGDYRLFAWDDADPDATLDPEFRRPFLPQSTPIHIGAGERQTTDVKAVSVLQSGRPGH